MHLFYYILLVTCFFLSLVVYKQRKWRGVIFLVVLLLFGIIIEIAVDILKYYRINHRILYHIYIPIEFTLVALVFSFSNQKQYVKRFILYSIPFFILLSLFISFCFVSVLDFPGLQFNIEGVMLIMLSLISLFSIEVREGVRIGNHPIFWFSVGLLIFHSGLFFLNGLYNYYSNIDKQAAMKLNRLLNGSLNILLYLFWVYSLICSLIIKRYC